MALRAEKCQQCLEQGKNLKPLTPKAKLGPLPTLKETNEKIQLYFLGPISDSSNPNTELYIVASVNQFSRYPSALVHTNCNSQTALYFLNNYWSFHGITRSKCFDQAQAFKSTAFEIYCKDKKIKLILFPTHNHRASGRAERLIQTLKSRLASMNMDTMRNKITVAKKFSEIIESIRLIPNQEKKLLSKHTSGDPKIQNNLTC